MELKTEYDKLLEESMALRDQKVSQGMPDLPPVTSTTANPKTSAGVGEAPQVSAYREILAVQEEVDYLAKENSALVDSLSEMMKTIEAVRGEISTIDASLQS